MLIGQQTVIQLSDPLGNGSNWLGTGGRGIDSRLADPTFVAVLQVARWSPATCSASCSPTTARSRCCRGATRSSGSCRCWWLMVAYTVGGLTLLFAS